MDVRSPVFWLPLFIAALSPLQSPATSPRSDDIASTEADVWSQEELEAVSEKIKKQIEELRGQKFKSAVKVEIQDKDGLIEYMKKRQDEFVPESKRKAEEELAKLFGLVPPEMDLQATLTDVIEQQVGGFYDPAADAFYLMESFTGDLAEIILAHELTHALDDQHYDLDGKLETLLGSTDAVEAYRSVIEGSATYAMQAWMMKYGMKLDPKALMESQSSGMGGLDEAPAFIWKPLISAYMTGMGFMAKGDKTGDGFIERAFLTPPTSMEQVLHPEKYWGDEDERDEPSRVTFDVDEIPGGWEVMLEDTFGEMYLALMTADTEGRGGLDVSNPMAMLGIKYTNDAAAGWDGDRVVLLGKGGARVARMVTVWDTEDDAAEFAEALQAVFAELDDGVRRFIEQPEKSVVDVVVSTIEGNELASIGYSVSE
jgi:hypothetical protein